MSHVSNEKLRKQAAPPSLTNDGQIIRRPPADLTDCAVNQIAAA